MSADPSTILQWPGRTIRVHSMLSVERVPERLDRAHACAWPENVKLTLQLAARESSIVISVFGDADVLDRIESEARAMLLRGPVASPDPWAKP